ncbi:hypothetical protein L1887_29960 [Cichorium endivia]|nr:hypothetical protein L1887_29960 [Cichorium endivia]
MTTSASTPHRAGPNRQGRESNPEVDLRATIAEEVSRALREAVPLIVEQNRDIIAKMMEERLNTNRRAEEVNENMDQLQVEQPKGDEALKKDGCSNSNKSRICYECYELGHVRVDYPKFKNREACSKMEVVRCRRGPVKEERDIIC